MFNFAYRFYQVVGAWLQYDMTWTEFKWYVVHGGPEEEYTSEYIECSLYKRHK